jgi:hypothetical protein
LPGLITKKLTMLWPDLTTGFPYAPSRRRETVEVPQRQPKSTTALRDFFRFVSQQACVPDVRRQAVLPERISGQLASIDHAMDSIAYHLRTYRIDNRRFVSTDNCPNGRTGPRRNYRARVEALRQALVEHRG